VTSTARIEANRRNARLSTGPRTRAGKARAAQNARRHGLNLQARCDAAWADEIKALAAAIAGAEADPLRFELAGRIAAAQIDVQRARAARRELLPRALEEPKGIKRLAAIDFYERCALARRKAAIRDFDAAPDFVETNPTFVKTNPSRNPRRPSPSGARPRGAGRRLAIPMPPSRFAKTNPTRPRPAVLERDDFSSNRRPAPAFWWSMIFFRKPVPTFRDHALGAARAAGRYAPLPPSRRAPARPARPVLWKRTQRDNGPVPLLGPRSAWATPVSSPAAAGLTRAQGPPTASATAPPLQRGRGIARMRAIGGGRPQAARGTR